MNITPQPTRELNFGTPPMETLANKNNGDPKIKDWLSDDMTRELFNNKPDSNDIDDDTGVVNKEALEIACKKVFTMNRQFINFYQAKQFADNFSGPWGMHVTQESGRIRCSFSEPMKQKKTIETVSI